MGCMKFDTIIYQFILFLIITSFILTVNMAASSQLKYNHTWLGDTVEEAEDDYVQHWIHGMHVDTDGTVYANADFDESGRTAGIYREGKVIGEIPVGWGEGGYTITGDEDYIYLITRSDVSKYTKDGLNLIDKTQVSRDRSYINGLSVEEDKLLISDELENEIAIYDTYNLEQQRVIEFRDDEEKTEVPLELAAGDNNLWAIVNKTIHEGKITPGMTVKGAGDNVFAQTIEFHYSYIEIEKDMKITAQLINQEEITDYTKAGLMIRKGLDPEDSHAFLMNVPDPNFLFHAQRSAGVGSMPVDKVSGSPPDWMRLKRSGDTIYAYNSEDGEEWVEAGEVEIDLEDEFYIGFAVSSGDRDQPAKAEFENVTVDGKEVDPERWSNKDIGEDIRAAGEMIEGIVSSKTTREIRRYDIESGEVKDKITEIEEPTDAAIDPTTGELVVSDNGPDQNVKIYDVSSEPRQIDTLGKEGGKYSGTSGEYGEFKFNHPVAVGVDGEGNYYVAGNGYGDPYPELGFCLINDIRSFTPDGEELRWNTLGLIFTDAAVADPDNISDIYQSHQHYLMDYEKTEPGSEWGEVYNRTVDPFRYPDDPRMHASTENPIAVREIEGNRYFFLSHMYSTFLAGYKLEHEGYTAKPSMILAPSREGWLPTRPPRGEFLWTDKAGDGHINRDEFQTAGGKPESWGYSMDREGNIWQSFVDAPGARKLPLQGVDEDGDLIYDLDSVVEFGTPEPFNELRRIEYVAEEDTLYLTGFTDDLPDIADDWKGAGTVLARFDDVLEKDTISEPTWTKKLPYDSPNSPIGIDVNKGWIYVSMSRTAEIHVYDVENAEQLGILSPEPYTSGWHDIPHPIIAYTAEDGERILLAEENAYGKILIYRNIKE